MDRYYVNDAAQATGEHEVHKSGCSCMPDPNDCRYLGQFSDCRDALRKARRVYPRVDGCYYCCHLCHTG
jgi:hypothetical protein